jgi:nitroreductase
MDAIEAITTRRSIRKFTTEPVSEHTLHELLDAAMLAPSSSNGQPWHFVVITDRKVLDQIPKFHQYSGMLKEAPLAIVVCGDLKLEMGKGVWVQDCSAATENLLLAAHAVGLGAVWLGVYPIEERVSGVRMLLGLPADIIPLCIIAIGYPAETKPPANRFNPERVHRNKW